MLLPGSFRNMDYEGEGATCPDFGWVCASAEPKSRPITRAKFFIEKTQMQKPIK